MKYCVTYNPRFKYLDRIDEIKINFRRKDTTLIDFLLSNTNKRTIISINNLDDFLQFDGAEFFSAALTAYPELNFALKIDDPRYPKAQEVIESISKKKNLSHKIFFNLFVNDWDTLIGLLEYNPSDIYISENLGFEIKDVAELLHSMDIKVRVFPNVAQSSWNKTDALRTFFIRPEDVQFYEPYVDVCEFFKMEKSLETLYKIYAIDKHWSGKLNELISGFHHDIDSRCILPQFAESRINCRKKCMKGKGCHICDAIGTLAEMLDKNDLRIKDMVN